MLVFDDKLNGFVGEDADDEDDKEITIDDLIDDENEDKADAIKDINDLIEKDEVDPDDQPNEEELRVGIK